MGGFQAGSGGAPRFGRPEPSLRAAGSADFTAGKVAQKHRRSPSGHLPTGRAGHGRFLVQRLPERGRCGEQETVRSIVGG
jgi:hypothetical protein